jgi:hypothetical protein
MCIPVQDSVSQEFLKYIFQTNTCTGSTPAVDKTGCCNAGTEQFVSISNDTAFPTARLKTYAGVSTFGLWHTPARIVNDTWTWEVAAFEPADIFTTRTTAAVINSIDGREQMAFFLGWGTDWAQTSTFLQHAWINWMTRGVCTFSILSLSNLIVLTYF